MATEALRPAPAWGWQCRCVVGGAAQGQDGIQTKGHVGGPRPWGSWHGDGLGLVPRGGSTPPTVPHSTPKQAPRALAAAQWGLLGGAAPRRTTWSWGWKRCQVPAPALAPACGTPSRCDKNSSVGAELCRASLQPGVVSPTPL